MSSATDTLLDLVLKLPTSDRARVAAELIASLDGEPEGGVEAAWATEVAERIAQVDRGDSKLIDWETVKAEIEEALRRH